MRIKLIKTMLFLLLLVCGTFLSFHVQAAGLKDAGNVLSKFGDDAGVSTNTDLGTTVGSIIGAALSLVGTIFLILMVYAGYLWMTANGDKTQVDKAQEIIKAAIIGMVVLLSAYVITYFVTKQLGAIG